MDFKGHTAASTAEQAGHNAPLVAPRAGVLIGAHFTLWRDHGTTTQWLLCHGTDWGRGKLYGPNLHTWSRMKDHPFTSFGTGGFAIGPHLPPNTELPTVTDAVLSQIYEIIAAMGAFAGATGPAA